MANNQQALSRREQEMQARTKKRKSLPDWWRNLLFVGFTYEFVVSALYSGGLFTHKGDNFDLFFSGTGVGVGFVVIFFLAGALHFLQAE